MDKAPTPNKQNKTAHAAPSQPPKKIANPKDSRAGQSALEATSFLSGLFEEFQEQKARYANLTESLLSVEGRIELVGKTLCLTLDHLSMSIEKTDSAVPHDRTRILKSCRFAG